MEVCGGTPLAITVAAGLLATNFAEPSHQSNMLEKAIFSVGNQHSKLQGVEKILHISYGDLSLPAKSCFMYLNIFPENHTIRKDCLIWRWVAEGFIPESNEESSWEIGARYFNELIIRRLVQPVFSYDDDQAVGCTVHGVILDFIASLSGRENFVMATEDLRFEQFPCDVIRRLSLNCRDQGEVDTGDDITMHLSRVRSLTVFFRIGRSLTVYGGNHNEGMLDLSACKLVRVLHLEGTKNLQKRQLESIGNLCLLKYLGLVRTDVYHLPQQILALEHLSVLNLRGNRSIYLPAYILLTRKLVSLLVDNAEIGSSVGSTQESLYAGHGQRNMQELEELSTICIGRCFTLGGAAELVNKSKHLRMLGLHCYTYRNDQAFRQGIIALVNEVGKSALQSLFLDAYPKKLLDSLLDCWAHIKPGHLQKFELRIKGALSKVPWKMTSLDELTHLHIELDRIEKDSLRAIGHLPKLVLLKLTSGFSARKRCIVGKMGFPCLRVLSSLFSGMWLKFEPGAMPQLQRLQLSFGAARTKFLFDGFDFGIQHLSFLVQAHATIDCENATASDVEIAEAAIREQVSWIPNNPILEMGRTKEEKMMKNEELQS